MSERLTVRQVVQSHCPHGIGEFENQIRRYENLEVIRQYDGRTIPFPQSTQRYKHVSTWYLLEDGSALGVNESPRTGFSFPRSSAITTRVKLENFEDVI